MGCTQNNVFLTTVKLGTPAMRLSRTCSLSRASFVHMAALRISPTQTLQRHKKPSMARSFQNYRTRAPICLFGGKGSSRGENKAFSWDSLKDALGGLRKEKTIQDILRDQMQQREIGGNGGDGNPPGSGGGRSGSDGTEDDGFADVLDETVQVFLATLALIVVYIYIIKGAELTKLARDCIRYFLGDEPSPRLKRIMDKWKGAFDSTSWTPAERDELLVRLIVTTPTWWHNPEAIARAASARMKKKRSRTKRKDVSP